MAVSHGPGQLRGQSAKVASRGEKIVLSSGTNSPARDHQRSSVWSAWTRPAYDRLVVPLGGPAQALCPAVHRNWCSRCQQVPPACSAICCSSSSRRQGCVAAAAGIRSSAGICKATSGSQQGVGSSVHSLFLKFNF